MSDAKEQGAAGRQPRRDLLRGGAALLAAGGAALALPESVRGQAAQPALLDAANTFTDPNAIILQSPAEPGDLHLGIDGSDGRPSFAGGTMPERSMSLRISYPGDPRNGLPGHVPGEPVDLHIVPYNAGMAIDFQGIVECWVEDWSIHNNNRNGGLIGDEARFWVGNNLDTGGLLVSAHTEPGDPPRNRWTRLVSRNFPGTQGNGPMQFIVRDPDDHFTFGFGDTGGGDPGQIGDPTETVRILSDGTIGSGTDDPRDRIHLSEAGGTAIRLEDPDSGRAASLAFSGSTFSIRTHDSSGAVTGSPLSIDVASGRVTTTGDLSVGGDLQTAGEVQATGGVRGVRGGLQPTEDISLAAGVGVVLTSPNGRVSRRITINNKGKLKVKKIRRAKK